MRSVPRPRVVSDGVPMRMPEGSKGLRGSEGTVLWLVTIRPGRAPWRRPCPVTPLGGEVDEDQVVVGAAGDQVGAAVHQRLGERPGVGDDGVGVVAERGCGGLVQRDRDGGRGVVVRAALEAGEDRLVDGLGVLGAGHQHAAARAAQRLVGGGGDDVGVRDGRRVGAAGDQAGDVRDVGDQDGADLVGDLARRPRSRWCGAGGAATEDDLRASLRARSRTSSKSMRPVSARDAVLHAANHLPVAETPQPWVRWPPVGSDMPSTVSPGSAKAR